MTKQKKPMKRPAKPKPIVLVEDDEQGTAESSAGSPVFVRMSKIERDALDGFIGNLNDRRIAAGLRKTTLGAWARDMLLSGAGRADLTANARLRREVELADSAAE